MFLICVELIGAVSGPGIGRFRFAFHESGWVLTRSDSFGATGNLANLRRLFP
jgi:hypothetical protein